MLKLFYSYKAKAIYHFLFEYSNYTLLLPNFSSYDHFHAVYHLVFILDGKGVIKSTYGSYSLSPGDIILINPNEKHIFSTQEDILRYYAVNFRLQQETPPLSEQTNVTLPLQRVLDIQMNKLYVNYPAMLWENIKKEIEQHHIHLPGRRNDPVLGHVNSWIPEELSQYVFDFFSHIYLKYLYVHAKYEHQQHQHPLIMKITSYLQKHLGESLAMDPLAKELGYNASYLSRFFKNHTSISISEYFLKLKIQKSCELIRMTKKSITEIALELGFSSSQHFCRTFKSLKTVSPGKFRKNFELY